MTSKVKLSPNVYSSANVNNEFDWIFDLITQKELGVTWDVDLYGELLKIGGGKERYPPFLYLSCNIF